jgi:EAL domain-containing protein (putative c-di-GMP-specific phosphodiesterase class I)
MVFGYEVLYRKGDAPSYPSASCMLDSVSSFCEYKNNFQLFINMTEEDIVNENFCRSFLNIMEKKRIDGSNIVLEVSEDTHPDNLSLAQRTLNQLRSYDIKIALDDFGTKYSSILFLKELPIDIVKIDKRFVHEAPSSRKAQILLNFCAQVSHDIGCEVVAEGIETHDQLDCVKNANGDIGQGFLFTAPRSNSQKSITPFIELCEFAAFPVNSAQKVCYC